MDLPAGGRRTRPPRSRGRRSRRRRPTPTHWRDAVASAPPVDPGSPVRCRLAGAPSSPGGCGRERRARCWLGASLMDTRASPEGRGPAIKAPGKREAVPGVRRGRPSAVSSLRCLTRGGGWKLRWAGGCSCLRPLRRRSGPFFVVCCCFFAPTPTPAEGSRVGGRASLGPPRCEAPAPGTATASDATACRYRRRLAPASAGGARAGHFATARNTRPTCVHLLGRRRPFFRRQRASTPGGTPPPPRSSNCTQTGSEHKRGHQDAARHGNTTHDMQNDGKSCCMSFGRPLANPLGKKQQKYKNSFKQ